MRLGKRNCPASAESGTPVPQTVATHRDSVGPQRSHRRHHNVAERHTQPCLGEGSGMERTVQRGQLLADIMGHVRLLARLLGFLVEN
jgi:hypothetical protein